MDWRKQILGKKESERERKNARARERYRSGKDSRKDYYKKKMAEDPLFNRKVYLEKKTRNKDWNVLRGEHNMEVRWEKFIQEVRKRSDVDAKELAKEFNQEFAIVPRRGRNSGNVHKAYRPRISTAKLKDEEIGKLTKLAADKDLKVEYDVYQSSVEYRGEMLEIQDKRKEKRVDVYTANKKDDKGWPKIVNLDKEE